MKALFIFAIVTTAITGFTVGLIAAATVWRFLL
jgi:hypothetical protein